jgi:exosortase/archaeosortase family protein
MIAGWILFGIFWLTQIPYFFEINDNFNAIFCLLGFILFSYFAFHEYLNYKWNEYVVSLNYIAGIVSVGGLFYYFIERFEPIAKGLIYIVASQSVWVLNLFGTNYGVGSFGYDPISNDLSLSIPGTTIGIILACTGIQSIAIFVGILLVTKPNRKLWVPFSEELLKEKPPKNVKESTIRNKLWTYKKNRVQKVMKMTDFERKARVFLYTIPVIYVLNIFRNVSIIWGVEHEVFGDPMVTFDIAHNYLSKFMSLGVLIILVYIVFELLPECQEGIIGLLDLPQRVQPGMVKDGFIELKTKKPLKNSKNSRNSKTLKGIKDRPKKNTHKISLKDKK